MPERPDDGQPLNGPYDDRDLPQQGDPTSYRCHQCNKSREFTKGGALICRTCDQPTAP